MTTMPWWQPIRPPKPDPRNTGVTFVDVLFALVVGKILDVSAEGALTSASFGHLAVGAVLTITSWVGYHNSVNRVTYFLRFWNLPIFLFLIDIVLVYIYWLIPVHTVQYRVNGISPSPGAFRITALVTLSALLYVMWDCIALGIRKSGKYPTRPSDQDLPGRRYASIVLLISLMALTLFIVCKQPHTTRSVVAVDGVLIVLLLGYRTVKERLTPPGAFAGEEAESNS